MKRESLVILLLILVNLVFWSLFVPVFEAGEEPSYYQHVVYLNQHGRLPNFNYPPQDVGVISYPPLSYLPLLPIVQLLKPPSIYSDESLVDISNHRPGFKHTVFNKYKHDLEEAKLNWDSQQLAVHLMRLVQVLLGLGTVLLVFNTGMLLFRNQALSLLSAMFVGFNPMFAHISSSITVVNLLIFLSSLVFYLILKWAKTVSYFQWLVVGILVGMAIVTKGTGLLFIPIVIGGMFWLRNNRRVDNQFLFGLGSFLIGMLLTSGWWFLRNIVLYGELLAFDRIIPIVGFPTQIYLDNVGFVNYWAGFLTSQLTTFWSGFGWSSVYFPTLVTYVLSGSLIALVILAVKSIFRKNDSYFRDRVLFLVFSGLYFTLMLLITHYKFPAYHAKDMFPIIVPISLLVVSGLKALYKGVTGVSENRILLASSVLFFANLFNLFLYVSPKLFGEL